jgi:hypothetical protein
MLSAIVKVEPTCQESKLNANDLEVAGEYEVELKIEVTEAQIADVALDVFHANVTVKVLDDFSFTVLFDGQEMKPNPEHESYAFQHLGSM